MSDLLNNLSPQNPTENVPWLNGKRTTQQPWEIMDRYGRPIPLTESQRFHPMMGAYNSIYRYSYQYSQYSPDSLISREGYFTMGWGSPSKQGMLTMAACRSPYNLKRAAILQKGYKIALHPKGADPNASGNNEAQELAYFVQWMLENLTDPANDYTQNFVKVLNDQLSACWFGFNVSELQWYIAPDGKFKGKQILASIDQKPCDQIGFDLDDATLRVNAIKPYTLEHGYGPPCPVEKVLLYTYDQFQNLPYGNGLARQAFKHWKAIDNIIMLHLVALERFGGGAIFAKYPAGNEAAADEARRALDMVRDSVSIVLPNNADAQVIQASAGMFEGFLKALEWHKQEIAQLLLGNTLSMGEGQHGTQALGSVHQNTRQIGDNAIAGELEQVINKQLIRRAIRYNFGEKALELCPSIVIERQNDQDLFNLANAFSLLVSTGNMTPTNPVIREIMNLTPIGPDEQKILDEQAEQQREQKMLIAQAEASRKNPTPGSQAEKNQKAGAEKAKTEAQFAALTRFAQLPKDNQDIVLQLAKQYSELCDMAA